MSPRNKNLEELEKEEELRTATGSHDSEYESVEEEMVGIRQLAKQIMEKRS
jgi:nucleolar GTP-binding protein